MRLAVLYAIIGFATEGPVSTDWADVIEVNHYYDEHGKHVFDQVIFWEWRAEESAFRVIAWRFLRLDNQIPRRDPHRGDFVLIWADAKRLRCVRSPHYRETWTQHDPEVIDRRFFAQKLRRGLVRNLSHKGEFSR